MLDCNLCNYFKSVNSSSKNSSVCMCELTGFIFHKDVQDYDIEYPCYNFQFERKEPEIEEICEIEQDELKLA